MLRCHIEDDENGETVIYTDDRAFDLAEFGGLLRFFTGWGVRITFVPEDQVTEQPKIEVREPEDEEELGTRRGRLRQVSNWNLSPPRI